MNFDLLRGFYPMLDVALDKIPHKKIWTIFFSRREEEHSVTIAIHNQSEEDRLLIDELVGFKVPRHLYQTEHGWVGKIGVDVCGIGTDKLRLYVNRNKYTDGNFLEGIGYYLSKDGKVIGKKDYVNNVEEVCYDVTYYDENNKVVDADKEIITTQKDWNGSEKLVEIAKKQEVECVFTKKKNKDQAYFIMIF